MIDEQSSQWIESLSTKHRAVLVMIVSLVSVVTNSGKDYVVNKYFDEKNIEIQKELDQIDSGYSGHFVVDSETLQPLIVNFYAEKGQPVIFTMKADYLAEDFVKAKNKSIEVSIDGELYKKGIVPSLQGLSNHNIASKLIFDGRDDEGKYHQIDIRWNELEKDEKLIINTITLVRVGLDQ